MVNGVAPLLVRPLTTESKGTCYMQSLLRNSELFVFTDNTTAESAFYKGTSSSKRLFQLVLDLHKLQLHGGFVLHLIHVAGQRIIAQGTDGLSRGSTYQGVMAGTLFLKYVSLH
jgi:hypothetical protein